MRRRHLYIGIIGIIGILILASGLLLDLANHGLVWQAIWSVTGEESISGQLRGLLDYLGNVTRRQPYALAPETAPAHAQVNPYGINVFLQNVVEPAKRERQVAMIAEAGFHWLRQEFPWEDIEIHARGDFTDRRNDPDGIDAWAKYDHIVDLAEQYGLALIVRLGNPPAWSREAGDTMGAFAPPDDFRDFVNFAVAVAERYRGRIRHYQIWNEPNIYPEWGEYAVDPDAYTELLCSTHAALKALDPEIVVISGALAPTVSLSGRDLNDFIFLERMYAAGAGECFDVLAMQGYGLNSGPTDRRMRPTTVNYSRNLYIREMMVAHGDADKAIWISEMAWNVAPESMPAPYGRVSVEQQTRWTPMAYQRAREEWPWVGVINYWFFKLPSDQDQDQPYYYFRMVEPDFSPMPVYAAMKAYIAEHPGE